MKQSDTLTTAINAASAWRSAALILAIVSCTLAATLAYKSVRAPAYLIPYEFALSKGRVKVEPGKAPQYEYLQRTAIADIGLLLNWKPETVKLQVARFLNRLSSSLYAAQSIKLTEDADLSSKNTISQVFYPGKVEVSNFNARVYGSIIRWQGSKEVVRAPATYIIKYRELNGYLEIDDIQVE